MRAVFLLSAFLLASCAADKGDWPELVPIDGILATTTPTPAAPTGAVEAQAAALRARAARLRGPVIPSGGLPGY